MDRPVTTKGDIFSVFRLDVWGDGQGGTSRTHHFETTHGRKTGKPHFAHHRMGQRID